MCIVEDFRGGWQSTITLTLSLGQWTSHLPTPILLVAGSTLASASVCPLHLRICGAPPALWSPTSQTPGPGSHTGMQQENMFSSRCWLDWWALNNPQKILDTLFLKLLYHLSKHAEGSLREGVELLLMCRQTQPHVDPNLNRHLQALSLVHGVLRGKEKNKIPPWVLISEKQSLHYLLAPL